MKQTYQTALRAGVASMVLGTALMSVQAMAQTAPAASEDSKTIVVTGSLLRRTSKETVSPVSVLSTEALDARGVSTVQDGLQFLAVNNGPALTNSFSANGAFAAGASAVSLRGLSTNSTLVLFDGLRAAYYPLADDGSRNFVDLNTIPDDIVENVEVLRDGASASYGADAIAGVVNVKTKRQFKGVSVKGEGGISSRGDAPSQRFSVTVGKGDIDEDGYNIYASGFYYHSALLYNSQRGYPYNTDNWTALGSSTNGVVGGVSGSGVYNAGTPTTSIFYVRPATATNSAVISGSRYQALNAGQCNASTYVPTATELASSSNATTPTAGVCQVDYANSYGVIQPEITRLGGSMKATAKFTDSLEGYVEVNVMQSSSYYTGNPAVIRGSAPTGIYYKQFNTSASGANYATGSGVLALPVYVCARNGASAVMVNGVPTVPGCSASNGTLNPNNPFAAQGYTARLVGRDLDTPTTNETRNRVFRVASGLRGKLTDGIDFNIGATAMHTNLRRTYKGYVYIQHLLDAIADGSYNFVNPEKTSQSVLDYVKPTNVKTATSDQFQVEATMNGKLFDLPGGPLQWAVGASQRYEAVNAPSANSDINGPTERYYTINAFGTVGSRGITAFYGEAEAPIIKQVTLSGAGRWDHYSSGQASFSPKFGVKFKPVPELLLRGTFSKGFRIPSFGEANALPTTGYVTNTSSVFTDAFLAQYGCSKAKYSTCPTYITSGSYGQTSLASPNLQPEKSRSITLGAVFEPARWISFTVDYYHIKKTGVITQPSNAPALAAYYSGAAIPAGYTVIADAPDVNFPTATPRVAFVQAQLVNANTQTVSGLDFGAQIKKKLWEGITWTSNLEASYIIKLETIYPDGTVERYDGTLGNYNLTAGSGTPKWKGTWVNALDFNGKVKVTNTINYYGGYDLSAQDQGGDYMDCSLNPGYSPTGCRVPRYITTDLNVSVKVNDKFTIYGTMNNVFDKMPPVDVVTYGANGYNPVQGGNGILGRYMKIGAKITY